MICEDEGCVNYYFRKEELCLSCVFNSLKTMDYDELTDMYSEGKELIDKIYVVPMDKEVLDKLEYFRKRWFKIINEELLRRNNL